jgi:hypothetical protein
MRRNGKGSSLGRSGPRQNQRELEVAVTGHSRMRVEASSLRLRNPWVLLLEKNQLIDQEKSGDTLPCASTNNVHCQV